MEKIYKILWLLLVIFIAIASYRITMAVEKINSLSEAELRTLISIDNSLDELNKNFELVEIE